jgi:hypothetical protein
MARVAGVLIYLAFAATVIFAVLGCAFIIGETMTDPGGVTGVLWSACWAIPMVALAVAAWIRPEATGRLLTLIAGTVAVLVVLNDVVDFLPRDAVGPIGAIAVFAVAVPLGFLGFHRPLRAGWLLLLVGAAGAFGILAALLLGLIDASLGAASPGSSTAVAGPTLLIGLLFLIAGWITTPDPTGGRRRVSSGQRPAEEEPSGPSGTAR